MSGRTRLVRHGGGEYEVHIGADLIRRLGELTGRWTPRFIVSSHAVWKLFGGRLSTVLPDIEPVLIDDHETEKALATIDEITTGLLERGARRDATIIAIGGGVVGDTAGFAAAVFLRGVRLVHVPTTLLAQCDSSIGGKVAVNHRLGKNLIGAFHPPAMVISDVEVLSTLPKRELLSGAFEALKSGVIADPTLFELCEKRHADILDSDLDILAEIVSRSVEVKSAIVESDERESDRRKLLNYGHTLGHGLEAALGYQGMSHGEAVAWGMIGANAIAVSRGLLTRDEAARIREAIVRFGPSPIPGLSPQHVLRAVALDKKFTSDSMVMALPSAIGRCAILPVSESDLTFGANAMLGFA